jgi:N-dimethylarginine dimethylaminohydrolase
MNLDNPVDKEKALRQWQSLIETYQKLGIEVEVFDPLPGLPDQVFPGDAIFLYGNQAIASNFSQPEREREVSPMVTRFEARGYVVHHLPDDLHFEGNGEAVKWNGFILAGYGRRSDRSALDIVATTLGLELIALEVQYPHFHVDTTVCPLDDQTLAVVPSGLTVGSMRRLEKLGADLVIIDEEEGKRLACNSMTINETVILSTLAAPHFKSELQRRGFNPIELDLSEFAKSGGGAKCLTLEAYSPINS